MTWKLSDVLSPGILPSGAGVGHGDEEGAQHPGLGGKSRLFENLRGLQCCVVHRQYKNNTSMMYLCVHMCRLSLFRSVSKQNNSLSR